MSNYTLGAIEMGLIAANLKKELCEWDAAFQRYNDVLQLTSEAMDHLDDFNDEEKQKIFSSFDECIHSMAFAYYVDDELDEALSLLERGKPDLLKSEVLQALCCWKLGIAQRRDDYMIKAFGLLEHALSQEESALWQENLDDMDAALMGTGYLYLADGYRIGIGGSKDLEKSYQTIEQALTRVRGEDQKNALLQVKSHYKRTFFGGWEFR